jgi:hypothetical protein
MIFCVKYIYALASFGALVWLRDYDGEVNLRIARRDAFGNLGAWRWGLGIFHVVLIDGGKIKNGDYVDEWKWASGRRV